MQGFPYATEELTKTLESLEIASLSTTKQSLIDLCPKKILDSSKKKSKIQILVKQLIITKLQTKPVLKAGV